MISLETDVSISLVSPREKTTPKSTVNRDTIYLGDGSRKPPTIRHIFE